jgi:subtilisin family serine protease
MRLRPPGSRQWLALLIFFLIAPPSSTMGQAPPAEPPHVPGEILVRFREGASLSGTDLTVALMGGTRLNTFHSGVQHWRTGGRLTTQEALDRLRSDRLVVWAEPNYIVRADLAPDDPLYDQLWGLRNTGQLGGVPGSDIDAEAAWTITTGSRNVLVGVIDTGIDFTHPDLAANIWTNPGEIAGNHIDDDLNGYVDDVHGWDFLNHDNDPMDDHFHGTHVAGTIGAVGNNAAGVTGVSWNVSLVALKFLDAEGYGSTAGAIEAVEYATAMGLDMTNNSWGGGGFSYGLLDAITAAGEAGVLFVAAAGNSALNADVYPSFPAAYNLPGIVSVAATDGADGLAGFSNYGALSVDLGAPGVSILSSFPGSAYAHLSGTSMAAPHVTGVASLLRAFNPTLPVASLKRSLLDFADPVPSLAGKTVTGGRLNAFRSLASLDGIPPGRILDAILVEPTSNTLLLSWTATGDDGQIGTAAAYDVRYATVPLDESNFGGAARATAAPAPEPAGSRETMELTGLSAGTTYHVGVKAIDDAGNAGPLGNLVEGTTLPPPTLSSTPAGFSLSLFTGQLATRTLTLSNAGDGTLDWSIPTPGVNGSLLAQNEALTLAKGEADPRAGTAGVPGPDSFGYRMLSSDEPGGPEFSWREISVSGTSLDELDGDDETSGPIELGFGFPFYGARFDAVRISTNGFLSFTSAATDHTNQPLPHAGPPENLLAPFWDDLDFSRGGRAYVARGADEFTVQFDDVSPYGASGSYTFQVILKGSGEMLVQYLSLLGPVDGATVGIQDGSGEAGLQACFNSGWLHDRLALLINPVPQWLSARPSTGRVRAGESLDVTLTVDAFGLPGGTYTGTVVVESNDPANPSVPHTVDLTVNDAPAMTVAPAALDFGTVFVGYTASLPVTIRNTGTLDLMVDIAAGHPSLIPEASALTLPAGQQASVMMTLAPDSSGPFSTTLTIHSNAPNAPSVVIPVSAAPAPAPVISIFPASFSEALLSGGTVTRTLRIGNTGGSDLVVRLVVEPPGHPASLTLSPAAGTIPPGASQDFSVTFEAGLSGTAVYLASILIETNIPDTPMASVPAVLSVTAAPDIRVSGDPVALLSTIAYGASGASTTHNMLVTVPPAGGGSVELVAEGDYGYPGEVATLSAESRVLGSVGGASRLDCTPAQGVFPLTAPDLAALAADRIVTFRVQNAAGVDVFCSVNEHRVRLSYEGPAEQLTFGSLFVGAGRSLGLVVANRGTATLLVTALASDLPEFTASPAALSLAPGQSERVTITFIPSAEGLFESMLRIHSNDADTPAHAVGLSGTGLLAPVIEAVPSSIASSLLAGQQESRELIVSNTGGSPLEFIVGVRAPLPAGGAGAPFTGLSPGDPASSNNAAPADTGMAPGGESWRDAAADFGPVASSPVPLTCVVEDPGAGFLYAQANSGTAFYRYRASEDSWEPLASAPVNAGNNGGAALLNGKVYTSYTGTGLLGVYDIASNTWSVLPSPLSTASITSDAARFLYLAVDTSFVRLDPATMSATMMPPPPFPFAKWGGMRHLSGVLYAHQGNGQRGFASFDIARNTWSSLPAVPAGAVLGAAIDPFGRDYYAYGPYDGTNLYRYSIDQGMWSVMSIPSFRVSDGGLGWLPSPRPGIILVQGEFGTQAARLITGSSFIRLGQTAGLVPPSGTIRLDVTLDAGLLLGGQHAADIVLASNDPVHPELVVPVTLAVTGVPMIRVGGAQTTLDSVQDYTTSGAATSHQFPVSVRPVVNGSLEVIVDGDYGSSGETASVAADGLALGTVGGGADVDCRPASRLFLLADLDSLAADGSVQVFVQNSTTVEPVCSINRHTVRLSYEGPNDHLELGSVFLGLQGRLTFLISNVGTDVLHVESIASSAPEFTTSIASIDLAPGESRGVEVGFRPSAAGPAAATLVITSDDPGAPAVSLLLTGTGLEPPAIDLSPSSMDATLLYGQQETRQLMISNTGGSPLEFGLGVRWRPHVDLAGFPFRGLSPGDPAAWDNGGTPPEEAAAAGDGAYAGIPGDFDRLAPSPSALTCVVEDRDNGALYAQANQGNDFFRYVAASDEWQYLAPAPMNSGNNGGAALLNGKVYTSYRDQSSLGVYDIASNTWARMASPLASTANIVSDGVQFLYLVGGQTMIRLDPATSSHTAMAPPPFYVQPWAGVRHLSGVLYLHQGAGQIGFASYDIVRNAWTRLASVPSGTVLGAAIDPFGRHVYAYGAYGGANLYRYSIDDGVWSVASIPFFTVSDGGMGWLLSPLPGLYFVQGENGNGFTRMITGSGFVRLHIRSGVVPAAGAVPVDIAFDTSGLLGGLYEADILVSSNDPESPELVVPVSLQVIGRPILELSGERVTLESVVPYLTAGALTTHALNATVPPAGTGTLSVGVEGDLGDSSEYAEVHAEGAFLGSVVGIGYDCIPVSGWFPLPAAQMAALTEDAVVRVTVRNSAGVDAFCSVNRHVVKLTYSGSADRLDFGELFLGRDRTRTIVVANTGTDDLHVDAITSSLPDYTPSVSSFNLSPGSSRSLGITFRPLAVGSPGATLSISSDDQDTPIRTVLLTGTGLEPPVVAVAPASLDQTLPRGDSASKTLTISNSGGSPLHYTLDVVVGETAGAAAATGGTSSPGAAGQTELLKSSPAALTCVVEDRAARVIYGQAAQSSGFYRYRAETNDWETLSSSPIGWGGVGGAALLNGKVYTSYTGSSLMGVYNISSDSWTTISSPLGNHGNIASDGTRYLYLITGFSLVRFDPGTMAAATLASPPFYVDSRAGIRHLSGVLYAHQGGGYRGFASFDIVGIRWTTHASPPAGLVLGSAIDPYNLEYFAYGSYGDARLYRYTISGGTWSSVNIPFFSIHDGGMGWLLAPAAGIYFVQGRYGSGLGRYLTGPDFVQLGAGSGTVAPQSSMPVEVSFSVGSLPTGSYPADIRLSSNDPVTPVVTVSADLTVVDRPRMTVSAVPVLLESSRSYNAAAALTSHLLTLPGVPGGNATLELLADGEYENGAKTASISSGGVPIGNVGGTGYACWRASGAFVIPLGSLSSMIHDGVLGFEVKNSLSVGTSCPVDSHLVKLGYPLTAGRLDFLGQAGRASNLLLRIANTGSAPLTVTSLASSSPLFVPSRSSLTVGAASSIDIPVTFSPLSAGTFQGSLTIHSDDPESPVLTWPLEGTALEAGISGVEPSSMEETLLSGSSGIRTLTLSNTGPAPLHVALNLTGQPAFLSIEPATMVIPPGGSTDVSVRFDTQWITPGLHGNQILVTTSDPFGASRVVPAVLHVVGIPRLRLVSGNITVESTASFPAGQLTTSHHLALPVAPGGSGSLELIAKGDFLYYGRTATVQVEGVSFGSVGGNSLYTGCTTAAGISYIPWSRLSTFAADRFVNVTIQNSSLVTAACPDSSHTVRLTYGEPLGFVDMGDVMAGGASTRSFKMENSGTDTLHVSQIGSDSSVFTVVPTAASLSPGATATVTVTFSPPAEGAFGGSLSFASNDPDEPVITIPVRGTASEPPVIQVAPASLETTLRPPAVENRTLGIRNAGVFPLSFSITGPTGGFVTVSPPSGVVPSGGVLEVTVRFDSTGVTPGRNTASLDISSNDPLTPHVSIPVSLYALGKPAILLEGPPITVQRSRAWTTTGALTIHRLALPMPPAMGGEVTITVEGAFAGSGATAAADVESIAGLSLGGAVGEECVSITGSVALSAEQMTEVFLDRVAIVRVQNSPQVAATCPVNRHAVSLTYGPIAEAIDFGGVFVGTGVTRDLIIRNTGTDDLHVSSILTDGTEFSAGTSEVTLPPDGFARVTLRFSSWVEGEFQTTLHIQSDDVGTPEAVVVLYGVALPTPAIDVQPAQLTSVLVIGGEETRTLDITNMGGSDLIFSTQMPSMPAPFFSVSPFAGTVFPGESTSLSVRFVTEGVPVGIHAATLEVASNDPFTEIVTVPIVLEVIGLPDIGISGDELLVESTLFYEGGGSATQHHLVLPSPPAGTGTLHLRAEGAWGDPLASAAVSMEGTALGAVQGLAGPSGCGAVTGSFPIPALALAAFAADGAIDVLVRNSDEVAATCTVNGHAVSLSYRRRGDLVEFGEVYPGHPTARSLRIENHGTAALEIDAIVADDPAIAVAPSALSLAPGETATLSITLTPGPLGPLHGAISVHSNDPETPQTLTRITGTVVMPPVAQIIPVDLVAALPPGGTTTRALRISNAGASDLRWSLTGGASSGPAALPSWISVTPDKGTTPPGGFTDVTLALDAAPLGDGDHVQTVILHSNDPVHGSVDVTQRLHVGEVPPEFFLVEPASLNLASNGWTVKASLQLPAAFDPRDIVMPSVRLNGALSPIASKVAFLDENLDGRTELVLKFDRLAFQSILPPGQGTTVALTGEVRDRTWFRGTAFIRMIRPAIQAPDGGELLLLGQPYAVSWLPAPSTGAVTYTVILSRDGGESWEYLARDLPGTSHVWSPSGATTSQGRIRVLAQDAQGLMGYDTSEDFTVAGQLAPPHGVRMLEVRSSSEAVVLSWTRPAVDVDHGPAAHYRVLRATRPGGPFVEILAPTEESATDPELPGSPVVFYKVVAVNAAGESTDAGL